jgi:hypothetical protein
LNGVTSGFFNTATGGLANQNVSGIFNTAVPDPAGPFGSTFAGYVSGIANSGTFVVGPFNALAALQNLKF